MTEKIAEEFYLKLKEMKSEELDDDSDLSDYFSDAARDFLYIYGLAYEQEKENELKKLRCLVALKEDPARLFIGDVLFEFPRTRKDFNEIVLSPLGRARELLKAWNEYLEGRLFNLMDQNIEIYNIVLNMQKKSDIVDDSELERVKQEYLEWKKWTENYGWVAVVIERYINDKLPEDQKKQYDDALPFNYTHNFDIVL